MKQIRGYVYSREFLGERCPQHVQNIIIRDYCLKNNLRYLLSGVEYAMPNSFLILNEVVQETFDIDGIVLYSTFLMPESEEHRMNIYNTVLNNKGEIHFALEGLKITKFEEIGRIENIWKVRQALPSCIKEI
jgi:sporadic carbohydrate cluster protein (TIGR04323 family)